MIGDRWGVSDDETLRTYPCDDFVDAPALQAWRGVRVEAPAEAVWPWVAQVRLAPYAYDWIDNRARRSPRELAGLPEPHVGERFTTAGGRELGRIVSVDQGKQLTGTIMGAFMSYVLVPEDYRTTRLLLKVVMQATRWIAPALSVGDLIMARRQLLNLKQHTEHHRELLAVPGGNGSDDDGLRRVSEDGPLGLQEPELGPQRAGVRRAAPVSRAKKRVARSPGCSAVPGQGSGRSADWIRRRR